VNNRVEFNFSTRKAANAPRQSSTRDDGCPQTDSLSDASYDMILADFKFSDVAQYLIVEVSDRIGSRLWSYIIIEPFHCCMDHSAVLNESILEGSLGFVYKVDKFLFT
jgi:hypothetical protein